MQFTWLKTWVFCAIAARLFLDGAEEFFITPTAWYYMKSLGQSMKFLGMVLSAYPVGALLAGPVVGKLSDRFGHVKCIIIFSYVMKVVGNILYSIPISAYFPLIGRIVSGLADGSVGVLYGQIIMYTPKQHRAKCLIIMDGMFTLGTLVGPMVSVFLTFHINILGWRIDAGNSPGIVLALIWSVMLVNALWFPKEFGYKKATDDEHDERAARKSREPPTSRGSLSTICSLFYLIFVSLFYTITVTFYVPVLAQEHFHLQFLHVKLLFLTSSIFAMVLFFSIYLASEYVCEMHLLISQMLMQVAAISILTYFAFNWDNVNISGVYGGYILIAYICLGMPNFSFALGCSLLSKVTDPKDAAFYQGSSFATLHSGFVASRLISAFIFTKTSMLFFCMGLTLSWVLALILLAVEYRNLTGPKMKS